MALTREQVMAALRNVEDPEVLKDVVTLGMVKEVQTEAGRVRVVLVMETDSRVARQKLEADVQAALRQAGAERADVVFAPPARPAGPSQGAPAAPGHAPAAAAAGAPRQGVPAGPPAPGGKAGILPQVKHVIAVGAGKGGVGKSTLAVNLAIALRRQGARVGLMDGDIYGPSVPTLLGIRGQRAKGSGNKILPVEVHGIWAITIGLLVEEEKPLIWRGPMAHGAFRQLLAENTEWPELDYMIVDLPPGTGDVPLTLCQLLPLTGAVVVATPQQVALDDAVRAVRMFQQLGAPVLGLVENMSYFIAPDGSEHDIFGRGGTEKCAQRLGLPYLGAVPMFTELRVNSDGGDPEANFNGSPRLRAALEEVTRNLEGQVSLRDLAGAGPQLTIS